MHFHWSLRSVHLCILPHMCSMYVNVCCLQVDGLTDDDGGDLVLAGSVLVLDLTDECGVDCVVHLPHDQLVAVHHHRVWQRTRRPGKEKKEWKGGFGELKNLKMKER